QAFLQCGTLHHHERAESAGAARMNQFGDAFFPRSGLARNEHRAIAGCHQLDQFEQTPELRAFANERTPEIGRGQAALKKIRALPQRAPLDCPLNTDVKFIEGAGLNDIIESANADRFNGSINGAVAGQHDHLGGWCTCVDRFQDIEAVHAGQAQIKQDDIGLRRGNAAYGLLAGTHRLDLIAETTQFVGHYLPKGHVVINKQDGSRLHCLASCCKPVCIAGRTTSKVDPIPGVLSTRMSPPQLRTAFNERKRPSPVPPERRLKKGSKIFFRYSGGMPHPSSEMRTRTVSPPVAPTTTLPPGFEA